MSGEWFSKFPDWLDRAKIFERAGIIRMLLVLLEQDEVRGIELTKYMSTISLQNARQTLLKLGWISTRSGEYRRVFHSLTPSGRRAALLIRKIIESFEPES